MSLCLCINPNCQKRQNPDNEVFCLACGSQLLLQGRYRVIAKLGKGGFGQTYEINEVRTNQAKVLKVLINHDPKAIELFKQEAEVLSQLHHPGIPQVEPDAYFLYYPYSSQTAIHCLVMEKIEGIDLEEYMVKRGSLPIDQTLAIQWLKDLVNILQEVHHQDFFHRDIKPPNIMLRANNAQLTLIDFGTVRKVTQTVVNQKGGVTGISSAGYTPWEQINSNAVPQSDFFALGRTFVYLLTGKQPLDPAIYDQDNDQLNWRSHAPQISSMLADLLDDMMQRLYKDRPQTTEEILQRLDAIEKALQPPPPIPKTPPTVTPNAPLQQNVQPIVKPSPPTPKLQQTLVNTIFILTIIFFSGLVGYLLKPRTETNTPLQPTVIKTNTPLNPPDEINTSSQPTVIKTNTPLTPPDEINTSSQPTVIKTNTPSVPVTQTTPAITTKNITTATLINTLGKHSDEVNAVVISPDGQTLVSGSSDKTIKIWNLATGELKSTLLGHSSWVSSLAISPNARTLVSGSYDRTIKIWNLATGELKSTLPGHSSAVISLAISPDARTLVSGGYETTIKIWDLATGELKSTLTGHSELIRSLAISPNNTTLYSGSSDYIKIWNLPKGEWKSNLTGHSNVVGSLVITPDGNTLVSGSSDTNIKIWNLTTGELKSTLTGHSDYVFSLAISPDGQTLVSGSSDKTIKIWDLATGEFKSTLTGHSDIIFSLAISPDGKTLVSGSGDGTIKIWRLE